MAMMKVDGVAIRAPSSFTWGLQDISNSDAGRTDDTIMHKHRVGQKRKLSLAWNGIRPEEASKILKAFNPEYVMVQYPDAMENANLEKEFYSGDKTAPMKTWTVNKKLYSQLSFDIIER